MSTTTTESEKCGEWKIKIRAQRDKFNSCVEKGNLDEYRQFYPVISHVAIIHAAKARGAGNQVGADIQKELKDCAAAGVKDVDTAAAGTRELTEKIKADSEPNSDSWKAKIRANNETSKKSITTAMDNATEAAINAIDKLPPKQQQAAADIWSGLYSVVFHAAGKVVEFIGQVVNAIVDWIKEVWKKVTEFFEKIGATIKDAFESIFG